MRFVRCKTTSGYEAMILTPEQAYAALHHLQEPERTLTLFAAGTGLRISECLGLQWQDVSFAEALIRIRRTWTCGRVGLPKSKALMSDDSTTQCLLFPRNFVALSGTGS